MDNNQKYTQEARVLIDRLRTQCTNHNNAAIMPAHLLLELSAPGTRSAELLDCCSWYIIVLSKHLFQNLWAQS